MAYEVGNQGSVSELVQICGGVKPLPVN
jgi:hypothetical protein